MVAIDRVNVEHRVFGKHPSVVHTRFWLDERPEAWVIINVFKIPST